MGPPEFEFARVLGPWYVLFSNRASYYSQRSHPRLELEALAPEPGEARARLRSSLRYRSPDLLGRSRAQLAEELAVAEAEAGPGQPAQFRRCARGWGRLRGGRFWFPLLDPSGRWLAIWRHRVPLGAAPGLDLCTRDPSITQAQLDTILAALRAHEFLASPEQPGQAPRFAGLFATTQLWIPPTPYRLG